MIRKNGARPPYAVFVQDDMYPALKRYYDEAVAGGIVSFGGTICLQDDGRACCYDAEGHVQPELVCDVLVCSGRFRQRAFKERWIAMGVPAERIVDGCLFTIPGFDLAFFLTYGTVRGRLPEGDPCVFQSLSHFASHVHLKSEHFSVSLGTISYIDTARMEGHGRVTVGNYSCISWNETFELGINGGHNMERAIVYSFPEGRDWDGLAGVSTPGGAVEIGSDVWIGRGCFLKSVSCPLVIGDGAVIAADSCVVSDVPPYAVVGGNPARFIKWRFPEEIRAGLQRIRWWDWPMGRIYDARYELCDPVTFVDKYDPGKETC